MPFKSKKQEIWMKKNKPELAKEFEATPKAKKKVKKKSGSKRKKS